ncbi:hypothetical protein KP509_06G011700 [Ceratopteris richardii]|uniref:Nudix hydrolase domain-containing protein n=1 Tax=Ceratopteris richardii TaxID=49495 RepID=A0A8T2UQ25_CERRI|nr:hypothetical protein KP509_06G011700 [Ceratopteris richardii]
MADSWVPLYQRYEHGYCLVSGCVPFQYKVDRSTKNGTHQAIELLMVTNQGGPVLLFPKGRWETDETAQEAACREAYKEAGVHGDLKGYIGAWDFKSNRLQSYLSPVGLCRAYMFALLVKEALDFLPEGNAQEWHWWMKRVLEQCILHLNNGQIDTPSASTLPSNPLTTDTPLPSHLSVRV